MLPEGGGRWKWRVFSFIFGTNRGRFREWVRDVVGGWPMAKYEQGQGMMNSRVGYLKFNLRAAEEGDKTLMISTLNAERSCQNSYPISKQGVSNSYQITLKVLEMMQVKCRPGCMLGR
jgi:hypothetical protein